jgi:hypothetical protein
MMMPLAFMLDVNPITGFPDKRISNGEAALNGNSPDSQVSDPATRAAFDRLEAALERIALADSRLARSPATQPDSASGAEPEWAREVTTRLDGLIGDLRRVLSSEPA